METGEYLVDASRSDMTRNAMVMIGNETDARELRNTLVKNGYSVRVRIWNTTAEEYSELVF